VKAATLHQASVEAGDGFEVRVIVDI
jgi:SHS2 domain-containing protein